MLRPQASTAAALARRGLRRPMRSTPRYVRAASAAPGASRSRSPPRSATASPLLRAFSSAGGAKRGGSSPSFEIAAAFEGHDALEDEDEDEDEGEDGELPSRRRRSVGGDEHEDEDARRAEALSEQFRAGVEKKKRWMRALADRGAFAAITKSVADCYAPLYAAVGDAIGVSECPLVAAYTAAAAAESEGQGDGDGESKEAMDVETKFQPQRFDDLLAKLTEQEALALLVVAQQAPLAIAIVEHRLSLAQQLERAADERALPVAQGESVMEDRSVALSTPFRSFFSWAVGAYSFAQAHAKVLETYERAAAAEVYPTANMTATYLGALVALGRLDDAFAFYERVAADNRPVSVFFFRQLLFAASAAQNAPLALRVVDDMRRKGFKLRVEDYVHAMRAFDTRYFLSPRATHRGGGGRGQGKEQLAPAMDRYTTCMERHMAREERPEAFHELDEAASSVLALCDDAVQLASLSARHGALFPRAITAAVLLEDFDKALALVELHDEVAGADAPLHYAGVRMAVNAFLMLERPLDAWEFAKRTYIGGEQRRQCAPHFANVMDFLCIHDRVDDVLALLADARELEMQDVLVSNAVAKAVIPTLCRNVERLDDDAVWRALAGPKSGVAVLSSPFWCELFVDHCSRSGRMALVLRALERRSKKKVPVLKPRLALHLMTRFEARGEFESVAKVFNAMDKTRPKGGDASSSSSSSTHDRVLEIVERVYEALGMHDALRRLRRRHAKPSDEA